MCGLGGYIGKPIKDESLLWRLFSELRARGKDGYGYATYRPKEQPATRTTVFKDSVPVDNAVIKDGPGMLGSTVVLMHTRAATSGTKTAVDCHPLVHQRAVVVHNGQIHNHEQVRKQLDLEDASKYPQVDSFLIAYLIGRAKSIREGIEDVYKTLTGSLTFLVFTPKSPMTIWAASNVSNNLFQCTYAGQDYLVSNPAYFEDSLTYKIKRHNRTIHPEYTESGYLDGVWEISPQTMKQVVTIEDISKMKPSTVTVYQGKDYKHTTKTTTIEKNGKSTHGVKGGLYLIAGDVEVVKAEITTGDAIEEAALGDEIRLLKRGMIAEEIGITDMREILRLLRAGEMTLIHTAEEEPSKCIYGCGATARTIFEECSICFTCLLTQAVLAGKIPGRKPISVAEIIGREEIH